MTMITKFFGTSLSDEDFRRIQEAMEAMHFRTNRAFILAALEAMGSKKAVNPEAEKVKIAKEIAGLRVELGRLGHEMKKEGLERSFYPYDALFKAIEKENPGLSESDLRFIFVEKSPPSPKTARYLRYRDLMKRYLALKEKYQTLSPTATETLKKTTTKFHAPTKTTDTQQATESPPQLTV
jgi:hypothetical protein